MDEVDKNATQNTLLHYQCFYLNEGFEYDKYIEDKDLNRRLLSYEYAENKDEKLEMKWLNAEKSPVFHQWHPAANNPLAQPKGWEKIVIDHYHNKYDKLEFTIHKKTNGIEIGKIYKKNERPALNFFEKGKLESNRITNYSFEFPIEKAYSSFVSQFMKLEKNEPLILNQSFSLIDEKATSKAAKGVRKINSLLEKVKVSYRMTELLKHTYGNIDFYQVRDFLFYFIEDYYYKQENGVNGKPEKNHINFIQKVDCINYTNSETGKAFTVRFELDKSKSFNSISCSIFGKETL